VVYGIVTLDVAFCCFLPFVTGGLLSVVFTHFRLTRQTMDKHKDIFVTVAELPSIIETERITRLDSLAELVKLADSLLKPVLHRNDTERHTFCVIDTTARYEYFIIEPPSRKG
jgi:hypothetical protein